MFRKLIKSILGLALIGGIITAICYFHKSSDTEEVFEDNISPEELNSFHLDSDLEPMKKREYVSLNLNSENKEA